MERALLAELPEGLDRLLTTLAQRAALDADVLHLMEALPALARAHRYGDVRGTDTTALAAVADTLVVRICAGLTPAVTGLDAESARQMRQRMDRVHHAIGLLGADRASDEPSRAGAPTPRAGVDRRDDWFAVLAGWLDRSDVPTEVAAGWSGCCSTPAGSPTVRNGCTGRCRTAPPPPTRPPGWTASSPTEPCC